MASSKDSVSAWASAQLREKLKNSNPEELDVLAEAGLLDSDVVEFLIQFSEHYEPLDDEMPHYAHNTARWRKIVKQNASKNLRKAVRQGHTEQIHHMLGVVEKETDISGIKVYERFSNWIIREAGITYLAGHMGYGKTDFALLMAETFATRLQNSDKDVRVAMNIKSCSEEQDEVDYIDSQPDLVDWLENEDGHKLFVLDDGSDSISGYSGDNQAFIDQFKSIVVFLRKYNGTLIVIGHSGKDIHPHIRRLSDYVEKQGKKEAAVFENVNEAEGEDKKFDIENIPPTSWNYDTKEESEWNWADNEDDDAPDLIEIACKTYIRSKLPQQEVAKIFDISRSQISENYKNYTDEVSAA